MKRKVIVRNKLQNYIYYLTEREGKNFDSEFKPELTPKQMLKLGVFGGDYFLGFDDDIPKSWFEGVKLSDRGKDKEFNFFKISSSQPWSVWKKKGWIYKDDPLGWFHWYCRYFMGRRLEDGEDERQIKRWKAMRRHIGQIKKNCKKEDLNCRRRQRQALLHWAYDSRKI